jgi:hypothetical protein
VKRVVVEWGWGAVRQGMELEFLLFWLGKCFTSYLIEFGLRWVPIREVPFHSASLCFDPGVSCRVIDEVTRMVS